MIHLDVNAISLIASNNNFKKVFIDYLARTGQELLLNHFQMIELIKSSDSYHVSERIAFLQEIPKKRLLMLLLFEVVYQEIANYCLFGRILNRQEFCDKYTLPIPPDDNLSELAASAQKMWLNTKDEFHSSIGGYVFSKLVSQHKTPGSGKLRVRDFLRLDPNLKCSPFTKVGAVKAFDRLSPNNADIIVFGQYMHQVNRVENGTGNDILNWIQASIREFCFPKEIWNWKMKRFLDQDYFMRIARYSIRFLPEKDRIPEKIFKKINVQALSTFPSFFLVFKLTRYMNERPTIQKPSDSFDLFYPALLPYVDIFTCDNEIATSLTQVVKQNKIDCDKYNIFSWGDFKQKILHVN